MPEVTARVARARCRRTIPVLDRQLVRMARNWGDVDENVVRFLDELRDQLGELEGEMDEAVAYAEERDHG